MQITSGVSGLGVLAAFVLACAIYFLFDIVINTLVKNPEANRIMHLVLLFICIVVAIGGGFFIKV